MRAQCQCGQLSADVAGPTDQIVACHCQACQRRSGSPFAVMAYYPEQDVAISGRSSEYTRVADSGRSLTFGFCPTCGTSLWMRSELKPSVVGIPVGAFADSTFPAPVRSVWEQSMHQWLAIPGDIPHFPQGRS